MTAAIHDAISWFGSQTAMSLALGVSQPTVSEWLSGRRPVPPKRCVEIERLTRASVKRWGLRPADWHEIWPDMIGYPGAPRVPRAKRVKAV